MKKSGWNFQRINTMGISFYKSGDLNGSNYFKSPLRRSDILNNINNDKYCVLWSISDKLHPISDSKIGHVTRVSNYRQNFHELNIDVSDFTNGFKCSDMHRFEEINNLSINIFELNFCQDQNKWKQKMIPIEISKNGSDSVVVLVFYTNHSVLIKELNVFFLGKQDCR